MSLDAIESILNGVDPESCSERLKVIRDIAMSAVALLTIDNKEQPHSSGSGTLVVVDGVRYVLTARHVWEKGLKARPKLGITLRTTSNHKFLFDTRVIVPFGPAWPTPETDLGPDLVFLRIPSMYVGTIEAYGGVFYNLSIPESSQPSGERIETWFLLGSPGSLTKYNHNHNHASLELRGSEVFATPLQVEGNYDYIDARINVSDLPSPMSLGGVSGGGLWQVALFNTPSGKLDSVAYLRGVAFWQYPPSMGHRAVRCHGIESIRSVARVFCSDRNRLPIEVFERL